MRNKQGKERFTVCGLVQVHKVNIALIDSGLRSNKKLYVGDAIKRNCQGEKLNEWNGILFF